MINEIDSLHLDPDKHFDLWTSQKVGFTVVVLTDNTKLCAADDGVLAIIRQRANHTRS